MIRDLFLTMRIATMNKLLGVALLSLALIGSARALVLTTLDIATVTTGGTAVTALTAGHRTSGGWIMNPGTATANLCINERGTATTTAGGDVSCIAPGQTYLLAANSGAVSVVSSDGPHPFSGYGFQ
jgi:hypothetical protein